MIEPTEKCTFHNKWLLKHHTQSRKGKLYWKRKIILEKGKGHTFRYKDGDRNSNK